MVAVCWCYAESLACQRRTRRQNLHRCSRHTAVTVVGTERANVGTRCQITRCPRDSLGDVSRMSEQHDFRASVGLLYGNTSVPRTEHGAPGHTRATCTCAAICERTTARKLPAPKLRSTSASTQATTLCKLRTFVPNTTADNKCDKCGNNDCLVHSVVAFLLFNTYPTCTGAPRTAH